MTQAYADEFFGRGIADVDPLTDALIHLEEERQKRRIILIPSESYVPQSVREAMGSVFANVYAEGSPPSQMVGNEQDLLADLTQQLAYYGRYAGCRFHEGADYVQLVEALAQRRAAACFANDRVRADDIHVNVQPLSVAAANAAVYDALMSPGDTLMGMDPFQGGRLTHASALNVSGKQYKVVSYGAGDDGRLDYGRIGELAAQYRPRVIVTGHASYPWAPDLLAFREIADRVGAYLVADMAGAAGMAIAGVYPNPVGIADVVRFATHKTLCGPRGACIMTTDPALAPKIDRAVLPGLQGGPHAKFAATCVAFEIARSEAFHALQRGIVENARALARAFTALGVDLAYGGTDTHLLLLDLKSIEQPSGEPLYGQVVAHILDLAGIVVTKGAIPGDAIAALATGIQVGSPWVTERGMGPDEMEALAACIVRTVKGIVPFTYQGMTHPLPRGKIDLHLLEGVKRDVEALADSAKVEIERSGSDYPRDTLRPSELDLRAPRFAPGAASPDGCVLDDEGADLVDLSDLGVARVSGWRAGSLLQDLCTVDILGLAVGQGTRGYLLDGTGRVIDDVAVWREPRDERGRDSYLLFTNPENSGETLSWVRGLSDGYILFDQADVWRKVRGPANVQLIAEGEGERTAIAVRGAGAPAILRRVLGSNCALPAWRRALVVRYDDRPIAVAADSYAPGEPPWYVLWGTPDVLRLLWDALADAGASPLPAPRARHVLRERAGLPAQWRAEHEGREAVRYAQRTPHMFDLSKPYFVGQSHLASPAPGEPRPAFSWAAPDDAPLQRTVLYAEHERLGAKLVPFAGWEMAVWYTSVSDEHSAVRHAAGLFDVAHMGTIEVSGPHVAAFLDLVTVNYVRLLEDGESQYSALLDPAGQVLDDIIVYRRRRDQYLVVVNAANFDQDWAWLNAVNGNRVPIDAARPWVRVHSPAVLRDLRDPASGADQLVDIALQGPKAFEVLLACGVAPDLRARLARLARTCILEGAVGGIDAILSRTGYTGERVGYELYVHPDRAVALWRALLDAGKPLGLLPCGLAARDSLRIEAGLPLYGHELGGPLAITLTEAGFGAYVKYHKPFFVGRAPYKAYNDSITRQLVRFAIDERGVRAVRGGEHGEPVVNRRGRVIGRVTSCAVIGERQIGLALVEDRYTDAGTELYIYPEARRAAAKTPDAFEVGDTVALPVQATVLPRFPR
ncbi:MAG: glycine cleavage system aminomethyltransferase GcvT [Anaerolineae bacterium]|nr:glycine cleavage system aminomethyltransferase GcvT [Anaerolineae bacterium]